MYTVRPFFAIKSIGQSNLLASVMNNITVTLQANCDIAVGSTITLSNLVSTQTRNSSSLRIWFSNALSSDLYGQWVQESGTLAVQIGPSTMKADTVHIITFEIRNSASDQAAPSVSISGTVVTGKYSSSISLNVTDVVNGTLQGIANGNSPLLVIVPVLVTKEIGQTSPLAAVSNTISATLRPNCDFAPGSSITLSNLVTTQTQDNASLAVWSSPPIVLGDAGQWGQTNGTLVVTVGPGSLLANTTYTVWFEVQNSASPQAAPSVSVSGAVAAGVLSSPVLPVAAVALNGSAMGVLLGANPLYVILPSFDLRVIGQASPLASTMNNITVTLQPNCHMPLGTSITLTNLSGSQTTAGSLVIGSSYGVIDDSGTWTQTSGTLSMVARGTLLSNRSYVLWFVLRNGDQAHAPQSVHVAGLVEAGVHDSPLAAEEMFVVNRTIVGVINGGSPMLIVEPVFTNKTIWQTSPIALSYNNISIVLEASCDFAGGSVITLTNLTGSKTPDTDPLPIWSDQPESFWSSASWVRENGTLRLTVAGSGMLRSRQYRVWFELQNGEHAQAPPPTLVSASVEAGLISSPVAASYAVTVSDAAFGVPNGAAAMHIVVPTFVTKAIGQSSPLASGSNNLTVTLVANCDMPSGTLVTILNLTGSLTQNSTSFPILSVPALFGEVAAWTQGAGQLVMTVAASSLPSNTPCIVVFELQNNYEGQSSPSVTISATVKATKYDSPVAPSAMTSSTASILGVEGGTAPLLVLVPIFSTKSIGQSNPLASARNNITVTLQANCDFVPGSVLNISNLVGTQTGSLSELPLWSMPSGAISSSGSWAQGEGALIITVSGSGMFGNTTYIVWFEVLNPAAGQASPPVNISGLLATGAHKAPIASSVMAVRNASLLSVDGSEDPLFVLVPLFMTKLIGQTNPLTSASNNITVTLQANCDIAAGSVVTLAHITGAQTEDSPDLHIWSEPTSVIVAGNWTRGTGTLIATVGSAGLLRNTSYVLRFELQNSATEQQPSTVLISASIRDQAFYSPLVQSEMVATNESALSVESGAKPMYTVQPFFAIKSIGQSNPLALVKNNITVTLKTNCDVSENTVITLSNLRLSLTTDSNNHRIWFESSGRFSFLPEGSWSQANGSLLLTVGIDRMLRNISHKIWFELQNNNLFQESPAVKISSTIYAGAHPSIIPISDMSVLNNSLLSVDNCENPLQIIIPEFSISVIGQSTPLVSGSNNLTVTLQTTCDFSPGTIIVIYNLTGMQTNESNISIAGYVSPDNSTTNTASVFGMIPFEPWAKWEPTFGNLTLQLKTDSLGMLRNNSYVLQFTLRNGEIDQVSPVVRIMAFVEAGEIDSPLYPANLTKFDGFRYGVEHGSLPGFIIYSIFLKSIIGQRFFYPNFENKFVVTMAMNCDLPEHSLIRIAGLQGLRTESTNMLVLSGSNASLFKKFATWRQESGSLEIQVGIHGLIAFTNYSIFFNLQSGDTSSGVSNESVYQFPRIIMINGYVQIPLFSSPLTRIPMMQSSLDLQGVPKAGIPLFVQNIGVDWAFMFQNNPFPSMVNSIWAAFSLNADTPKTTVITISGFMGMQTPDDMFLPCISGPSGNEFKSQCHWNQSQGSLTLLAKENLVKGVHYYVHFFLTNPESLFSPREGFKVTGHFLTRAILTVQFKAFTEVQFPEGGVLGISSIDGLAPAVPGSVITLEECRNISQQSGVAFALHVCMKRSGLTTEVTKCLQNCNSSVVAS